jgi:hypothetical protein
MKALTWQGVGDVRIEEVPDPTIGVTHEKEDAMVKVVFNP